MVLVPSRNRCLKGTVHEYAGQGQSAGLPIWKSAVKLHTLLDLRGNIPAFIHVSEGKLHDVNVLDMLIPESGAFYVMDPAYIDVFVPYPQAGDHLAVRHPAEAGSIHNLTAENERCATGQVRGSPGTVQIAVPGFSGSVIVQIKLLWLIGRRSCKLDC